MNGESGQDRGERRKRQFGRAVQQRRDRGLASLGMGWDGMGWASLEVEKRKEAPRYYVHGAAIIISRQFQVPAAV